MVSLHIPRFHFILTAAGIILNRYKKEITNSIATILEESINGELRIGAYDITLFHNFPAISIALRDVHVFGDKPHAHPFLDAEFLAVNIEPLKLLRREISIKSIDIFNGKITMFRTVGGYSNLEVFGWPEIGYAYTQWECVAGYEKNTSQERDRNVYRLAA